MLAEYTLAKQSARVYLGHVMDVPALIDHALEAVDHNQAELARQLGVSETTVSRWRNRKNGVDFDNALRLARIADLPLHTLFREAGFDPGLLGPSPAPAQMPNLLQRQVSRHCRDMDDVNDMIERMPEDRWHPQVELILARAEQDIRMAVTLAMRLYTAESEAPAKGKRLAASPARPKHFVARRLTKRAARGQVNGFYVAHHTVSKVEQPRTCGPSLGNLHAVSSNFQRIPAYPAVAQNVLGCSRNTRKGSRQWMLNASSRWP